MRKYMYFSVLISVVGLLIYLSSVYLVKAENTVRQVQKEEIPGAVVIRPDPENPPEPMPPKLEEPPENPPEKAPEQTPPIPGEPPKISMEFENANLKDVLKIFCQQSGLNFIAGENVQMKPVTLYLNNVNISDALNSIIKANGLSYEQAKDSNVFIVTKTAEPEIKLETRIYKLKYAFVEDKSIMGVNNTPDTIKGVKESVQKLLTPNGDLSVDSRTNSLIVSDIPSRFPMIESSIKDLDSQLPQILIEAKIVELSIGDVDQLGIKWTSLAGYTLKLQDPTRAYSSERSGGQDRTDEYTTTTADDWERNKITTPTGGTISDTSTYFFQNDMDRSLTDTFTRTLNKSDLRSAILSADDFQVTLSLLLTDTNTDIISNPNIVTTHSRQAKITIGEQYPIPQFTYNNDTSTYEVTGFEYKDIGIILRVTPYADMEKQTITIELHPEVSSVNGSVSFRGIEIPIIATRDAITNVSIKNGDTLAIGGLLRDSDDTTIVKVPLLGDIPVLGNLFRHKEATKRKTNMIIFITPHILTDNSLAPPGASSEVTVPIKIQDIPEQNKNTEQKYSAPPKALPAGKQETTNKQKFSHR